MTVFSDAILDHKIHSLEPVTVTGACIKHFLSSELWNHNSGFRSEQFLESLHAYKFISVAA